MSDINYRSYWQEDGVRIDAEQIPEPPANSISYDDVLKLSNCTNTAVTNCAIQGGREDCIDACRGEGLLIHDCELEPRGRNGITIKGGFKTWIVRQCYFKGHGSECDIELGQFSLYDKFPFRNSRTKYGVIAECTSSTNDPLVVRIWNSDTPTVLGTTQVKFIRVPWIVWFPYFCVRQLQVKFLGK